MPRTRSKIPNIRFASRLFARCGSRDSMSNALRRSESAEPLGDSGSKSARRGIDNRFRYSSLASAKGECLLALLHSDHLLMLQRLFETFSCVASGTGARPMVSFAAIFCRCSSRRWP